MPEKQEVHHYHHNVPSPDAGRPIEDKARDRAYEREDKRQAKMVDDAQNYNDGSHG